MNDAHFLLIDPMSAGSATARLERLARGVAPTVAMESSGPASGDRRPYSVVGNVAVIPVRGLIVGVAMFYDEAGAGLIGSAIKTAVADDAVVSILLAIDSPGGEAPPSIGLADTVAIANSIKPVTAHIAGIGASGAMWVAAGAKEIVASRMARVGSIGVAIVIYDTSEQAQAMGVKPVVVQTSELKSIGAPGVPVTDAMIAELESIRDGYMKAFTEAIKAGRPKADIKAVATGQTWFAAEAKKLGLVDRIGSIDETINAMIQKNNATAKARTAKARAGMVLGGAD